MKVDVDQNQETAMFRGVTAMPTFKVFHGGREVGEMKGANPDGLRQLVMAHAGPKPAPPAVKRETRQRMQREAVEMMLAGDSTRAQIALETILKIMKNVLADP